MFYDNKIVNIVCFICLYWVRITYSTRFDCKRDEKVMLRNRNNRIPYPAPDTKRERNAYNQDGIK